MQRIRIGQRWLGDEERCYIVAEAGSNHNGSLEQALCLIETAAGAGADAVKFQHFKASKLYAKSAGNTDYLKIQKPIYEIIKEMELPDDWLPHLAAHCRQHQIEFLSSPFDEESADLLDSYVSAFKVASYEMTHVPLLRHIARKRKPMIVSTGTADLEEVKRAVEIMVKEGNDQVVLLQCTASYPTPLDAVNARVVLTLRQATGCLTGLSDHSRDPIVAPMTAVALGACLVEKHFTLSNRLPGPDHPFAIEPVELKEMVLRIRQVEKVLGHGRKEVLPNELELRAFARRSIFAVRDIQAGEKLTRENIAVLRSGKAGFGLHPEDFETLLGQTVLKPIRKETLVTLDAIGKDISAARHSG